MWWCAGTAAGAGVPIAGGDGFPAASSAAAGGHAQRLPSVSDELGVQRQMNFLLTSVLDETLPPVGSLGIISAPTSLREG